jgi:hypothetical protein
MPKISELTAITGANLATGDNVQIIDVSDTTMAATGTNKKTTLADLALAVNPTPDFQLFTSSGTWNKPTGAYTCVDVLVVPGAGGGASGRRGAAGTNRVGGGPGNGNGPIFTRFRFSDMPSTVSVTVGAGGAGGLAVTTDNTDGNSGNFPGASQFGTFIYGQAGYGSFGQAGGNNSGGAGGNTESGTMPNYPAPQTPFQADRRSVSAGGGGGGNISAANVPGNGANGGSNFHAAGLTGSGIAPGGAGGAGSTPTLIPGLFGGQGGGGGGAGNAAGTVAGGNGGDGGRCAGGGGGGASTNGANSGAGGKGGDGLVMVVCY